MCAVSVPDLVNEARNIDDSLLFLQDDESYAALESKNDSFLPDDSKNIQRPVSLILQSCVDILISFLQDIFEGDCLCKFGRSIFLSLNLHSNYETIMWMGSGFYMQVRSAAVVLQQT